MMQCNWLLKLSDVINGHQLWNVRSSLQLPQSHGRQRWCFVSEDKLWGFSEIRKLRLEFTEVLVRSCEGSNVVDELRVRTFASEKKRQSHRTVTLVGLQSFKSAVPIQALKWKNEEVGRQQFVSTSWRDSGLHYDPIVRGS